VLLATESNRQPAWYVAAYNGNLDVMQKLWELAKHNLTTEELKNNVLLVTDSNRQTSWHVAAYDGELDVMKELWELAKKILSTMGIEVICY
jgi:ankyrin repeat protein